MNNELISREYVEGIVEELENICQNAPEEVIDLLSKIKNAPPVLFPLIVMINDKVTDEDIETLKRLMRDYKPQFIHFETSSPHDEWIPVTYRPMTEEEEKELCEKLGIVEGSLIPEDWEKRVFTCHLPDDGQEILVSHGKYVCEDICSWDEYGCGLENNGDWDGVDAWMPKPEPYKREGESET